MLEQRVSGVAHSGIEAMVLLGDQIDRCLQRLFSASDEADSLEPQPEQVLGELSTLTTERHRLMEQVVASCRPSLSLEQAQLLERELQRINTQLSLLEQRRFELERSIGASRQQHKAARTYLDHR